jgi:hypothetical protein
MAVSARPERWRQPRLNSSSEREAERPAPVPAFLVSVRAFLLQLNPVRSLGLLCAISAADVGIPQAAASSGLDGGCGRKCPIALQPHFAGMPFSSPLALAVLVVCVASYRRSSARMVPSSDGFLRISKRR